MINSPPTDVICPVCGSGHIDWRPRETPPLFCMEEGCGYAFDEDEALTPVEASLRAVDTSARRYIESLKEDA